MWRHLILGTIACSLAACAPATSRPTLGVDPTLMSHDVLYAHELVNARASNVYEAVVQLRPDFFKRRGVSTLAMRSSGPRVYLDDVNVGGLEALRSIPLEQVRLVRYMCASEATFRWGMSHADGAILVATAR